MKIEDAPISLIDGDRGKKYPKNTDFYENEYCLFLNTGNVTTAGINYKKCSFITKEKDNELRKGKLEINDIVITTRGTIGNVFLYDLKNYEKFNNVRINSGMLIIRTNCKETFPPFLYYLLKNKSYVSKIANLTSGSAQPQLPINAFKNLDITLPTLEVQKEIADKISVYDDKIENNNKIINTLEEMATLLYKRYFVDFEFPNDEGKPYKSNEGQFVDSELGQIPIGWEVVAAKELVEFITGFEPGANAYIDKKLDDCFQFFRVKDLSEKQGIYIKKDIIKKGNNVNKKDVLVSFDGTIGRVAIGYEGCYSSGVKKILPKHSSINNAFIYFYMKNEKTQNTLKEHATGTTILHASKSIDYLNILYSQEVMEKFNHLIEPIYEIILNKKEENEVLVKTRDLLIKELIK